MDSRTQCVINPDTSAELICYGYHRSYWKSILAALSIIFSGGFMLLIFYWRPDWKLLCTHSLSVISKSTKVLLRTTDETNQIFVTSKTIRVTLKKSPSLNYFCQFFLLSINDAEIPLAHYGTDTASHNDVIYFKHHSLKYIWNNSVMTFKELGGLDKQATLAQLHQDSTTGLKHDDKDDRQNLYGQNLITVKVPPYHHLLMFEILNPFYVFQLFAVVFWMFDEYYIYAIAIFIMSFISAITSLIEVMYQYPLQTECRHRHKLFQVKHKKSIHSKSQLFQVKLFQGLIILQIVEFYLNPCIPNRSPPFTGTCIVNESMLTGESVPVTKTPLPSGENELQHLYDTDSHKRHTLFCGTEVLQTRFYRGEMVKAVVVRTGYHTAKGKLVHSILYPKPVNMQLLRDAYKFIAVLFLIAMCGFIYTVVIQTISGETAAEIALNAIDLITISVPPALPLAMTIGIIYAQLRLKKQKIHCISPQRINVSGQIDVVAFDKTGTMTEDGLDLSHIDTTEHPGVPTFHPVIDPDYLTSELDSKDEMVQCMVTCHTLTTIDGRILGDPLDLKMFEATKWQLVEPVIEEESQYDQIQMTYFRPPMVASDMSASPNGVSGGDDIGVVRQFPFASVLQRASVITRAYRAKPKEMKVYLKGAPEMVASLCLPSTVPADFHEVLKSYTQQGFRMIGMACKDLSLTWLKAQKIERSAVECDLKFLGLVALQNKLKPQSKGALLKLEKAEIRTVMVTGDNLLTALSVAHESGMIRPHEDVLLASTSDASENSPATLQWNYADNTGKSRACSRISKIDKSVSIFVTICIMTSQLVPNWHLAVSGHDFAIIQNYFPEWKEILSVKGTVFARMSPDQKTELMENLQSVDHHVCMCGDGANDCGALKRAHAGVSLSEHEASVAAPFTSHTDLGIECVPTLIREGRAALVTSFGMFKFMALYSLIQFCTITLLYNDLTNLSDVMYLYIDLIIIDLVAVTMSRNHACKYLHKKHPPYSLLSVEMLVSLMVHIILQLGAQLLVFFMIRRQCWYTTLTPAQVMTYDTSALFYFSCFLYMSASVAFSRGFPYRTPIYKNYLFIGSLLFLVAFTLFLI
uniref:Cation-transporting ATPase n=1 Tax=Ciona savignyi TaxID=51511 RepID=H2YT63_CIOSA